MTQTTLSPSGGPLLATLAQTARAPEGLEYWVNLLSGIATIVIAVALISVALAVIVAAWKFRGLAGRAGAAARRLRLDADPILRQTTAIAENANYITTALRGDVELLSRTVSSANQRINRTAALAENRIRELDALLGVVQEEAEDLFIGTASALRGVRHGAEVLREEREEGLEPSERRSIRVEPAEKGNR